MIYEDLTPSINQINSTIRKQRVEATRAVQSNGGGISINGGFSILTPESTRPNGSLPEEYQVDYTIATDLEEVAEWVTDLDQVVRNLEVGVVTSGRENTVSTEPPGSTEGYPDGAYWTQVSSADELVPLALWRLTDGEWVEEAVPENTVTPYLNTGLIDTAVLSAQIIRSDQFWTSLDSMPRVGFNADGFQAYDADGNLTVSMNGIVNTLEGELISGPWHIAKRGETYGIYCRAGHEQVTERSPGLVMVEADTDTGWPSYFNLRSQLWGSSAGNMGGPGANENVNAYAMIRSAHLVDGVEPNPEGTYTFADINWENQDVLIRNAYPGDGQSLWLHHLVAQLEWRNPETADQLNLYDAMFQHHIADNILGIMPFSMRGGQYVTRDAGNYIQTAEGSGYFQVLTADDQDTRTDFTSTTGAGIGLDRWVAAMTAGHGAAQVQIGHMTKDKPAELRLAADRIAQNVINTPVRFGQVHVGDLNGYYTANVTIGGWPSSERGTPRWHIILQPYDWNNMGGFVTKLTAVDHAAGTFRAVIETVARAGTVNCGFFWTAIKVEWN